jgi:hypothetical protein
MAFIGGPIGGHTAGPIGVPTTDTASESGVRITATAIRATAAITDTDTHPTGMVDGVDCAGGNAVMLTASSSAYHGQSPNLSSLQRA